MLTITAQLDDILYTRLQVRAQKRFGNDPDAMSNALREAITQYLSTESIGTASLPSKSGQLFSMQAYEEKMKNYPPVPDEWVQAHLASIKVAPISIRAPYVRPDGQMKRIPFQLPDSLDQKIQKLVLENHQNPRLIEQYGAIDTSTIIRDQIARLLLARLPLKPEPPSGGRIFGLSVNARLAQLLQDRLNQLKATGNARKNVGLATLIKRALTAALYHPHDDLVH